MNDQERLEQLVCARYPCISIVTHEEDHALSLIRDTAIQTGRGLLQWAVVGGIRNGLVAGEPTVPQTEHAAAGLFYLLGRTDDSLMVMLDLAGHLRDEKILRLLRDLIHKCDTSDNQLILIDHRSDLPPVVADYSTRFEVSLPDEQEIECLVRDTLAGINRRHRLDMHITRNGLNTIIRNLRGLSRRQARQIIIETVAIDRRFDAEDINTVLTRKRQAIQTGGLLEYVQAPVDLSEIGGLRRLKQWLAHRGPAIQGAAERLGLEQPRGVLMLGVQGAGKSLCAKAIATAWHRPLLRMDVGALYDKYVGESERRLRDALCQAEMMAPIVLWIDEIEKAFASAASQSTDGGLSRRMFGTLLTWMQEHPAPVFLVATANDIGALPPELLRKGRFDEIFFVDLPDVETRRAIFEIHLKKRQQDVARFDTAALAETADGFSGAEIEQSVIAALQEACAEKTDPTTERILSIIRQSPPLSVTMAEQVNALRHWAKNRCVPAD